MVRRPRPPRIGVTVDLTTEDLLELIRILGVGPIRDAGLLEAAVARPKATVLGIDAYPTIDLRAAALLHSLARNHPLVDGNKRLAWLATVVLLDLNGLRCDLSHDAAFDLVMGVADGSLDEVALIAERLSTNPK